ncbi:MAG: hypothetical protein JXR07_17365 [Reichenbachiella sp.]
MDLIAIFLIAVGIFVFGLFMSKVYAWIMIWRKASKHGLSPHLVEIIALSKFFDLEEKFLDACVKFKSLDPSISIKEIVRHHMADGDTFSLLEKYTMVINHGFDMSFESAVLYDLSGKDLSDIIEQQQKVYEIEIQDKSDSGWHYLYSCQFKISPDSSGWVVPDIDEYKWRISQTVNNALKKPTEIDPSILSKTVLENHLNKAFWKDLCHGFVIDHNIKIVLK